MGPGPPKGSAGLLRVPRAAPASEWPRAGSHIPQDERHQPISSDGLVPAGCRGVRSRALLQVIGRAGPPRGRRMTAARGARGFVRVSTQLAPFALCSSWPRPLLHQYTVRGTEYLLRTIDASAMHAVICAAKLDAREPRILLAPRPSGPNLWVPGRCCTMSGVSHPPQTPPQTRLDCFQHNARSLIMNEPTP